MQNNQERRRRSKVLHGRKPPPPCSYPSELVSPSGRSRKSDIQSPNKGSKIKHHRLRKTTSNDRNNKLTGIEGRKRDQQKRAKLLLTGRSGSAESSGEKEKQQLSRESDYDKVTSPYDKLNEYEKKLKDYEKIKEDKKEEKKEMRQSQIGSVFEPFIGPSAPARSGANGVKNKMKWKIDVDPVELKGDQKMSEILEKLKELRKSSGMKPCKLLKANEQMMSSSDDEPTEDVIHLSARLLQLVKMEQLISKEISYQDQELLKSYCRCGDHKDKIDPIFEAITLSILEKVASKNEFIRHVSIPAQLRIFAVDEKKSKLPLMALMIVRKDLFYYAWTKQPTADDDEQLDQTWSSMTLKSYYAPRFQVAPAPALIKSAHFQPYY